MTDTITITDTTTTELSKVVTQYELQGASADALQETFAPLFAMAKDWREKAASIKVTNIGQTTEMGNARKARLEIRQVRINAEKAKTKLKADSLRYGNAVQGAYNMILLLTEPVEAYLLDQEEYGKRLQERAQAEARDLRMCEAGKYLEFFPQSLDLGTIADEDFARLLHYAKAQWNEREEAAQKIEKERIEREQKEAAEREAMRAENERLKAEAEKAAKERDRAEAEQRRMREQAAKEIAAERAEVERLRAEAAANEEAERKAIEAAKAQIEEEKREREAAEKAAQEAPDREKFHALADAYSSIPRPMFENDDWDAKYKVAMDYISEGIIYMRQQ